MVDLVIVPEAEDGFARRGSQMGKGPVRGILLEGQVESAFQTETLFEIRLFR